MELRAPEPPAPSNPSFFLRSRFNHLVHLIWGHFHIEETIYWDAHVAIAISNAHLSDS